MTIIPQCVDCKHLAVGTGDPVPRCEAFPNGIPEPILLNQVDHRQQVPGDHGIQFSALPGRTSIFAVK